MSDTTTDEESLISQDDIDKLLNASSMDEVEDSIDLEEEEIGELSQDDIDALMNNPLAEDDDTEDDKEDLLPESGDDDLELVSQDDIDSLMDSALNDEGAGEDPDTSSGDEEDLELISQDDIGRLLGNGAAGEASESNDDDGEDLTAADGSDLIEELEPETLNGPTLPYDEPIDESEARDIQDCLITQETLDSLMEADKALPEIESAEESPGIEAAEAVTEESEKDAEADPKPEEDDFNTFLETELDEDIEEWSSEGEDISQDDIDSLLNESTDGDEMDSEPDETLISQDDINDLLQGSMEEDEDLLSDDDEGPETLEADDDSDDQEEAEETEHTVVLEESFGVPEDEDESLDLTGEARPKKRWYRSKLLLAAMVVGLILVIGLPVGYFTLFTGDKEMEPLVQEMVDIKPVSGPDTGGESVDINLQESYASADPGTVDLNHFVVLASAQKKGFGFITADLSLDYSNVKAFDAIEQRLPYYRDLVYNAMHKALNSDEKNKVTEKELLKLVKDALNRALPENYIETVSFTAFNTG